MPVFCSSHTAFLLQSYFTSIRNLLQALNGRLNGLNNLDDQCMCNSGNTLALVEAGFQDIEQVEEDNSYGVIDWFSNRERGQVLIPRSNLALNLIPDGLRELGFQVTTVTAYENIMPSNPKKVDLSEIDRIIFTSPSTIDNFVKLYGYLPTDKELKTRGVVTEKHLMEILNKNI